MEKKYLHVGCGSVILPKPFENLDGRDLPGVNHLGSVYPLDFEDNTFDLIYSSHVLEHFKTNDMMLVNRGYGPHGLWTKRDTFVLMGCDNEDYWNKTQLEAGLICLRNNQFNINFMNEWFSFCKNEQIISNSENQSGLSNLDGFIDHRQDQSILTNLQIKHNLPHQRLSHDMVFWNYNQPLFF
jgi:SAM-dependent methyltransferase